MACDAVTRRATTGPCVDGNCGYNEANGRHDDPNWTEYDSSHPYLGPVLERCGHEESEHMSYDGWVDCDFGAERPVAGQEWHAFEEES